MTTKERIKRIKLSMIIGHEPLMLPNLEEFLQLEEVHH
jgi:hypothetical protein